MKKIAIFFVVVCLNILISEAQVRIIRDSEIEEAVDAVVAPLRRVSGLKNLQIYLINNETPNAFTVGGGVIFVHSGLITNFPDPDVLRGIVAHEIGHILGNHIMRKQDAIQNYTILAMGGVALGILTALGDDASPGIAIMTLGSHVAERSVLAYSRILESSADQAALKLLEKSGYSPRGILAFFEKEKINNKSGLINPYEQTHPLSQERVSVFKNNIKHAKTAQGNSPELLNKFRRAALKLAAYTLDSNKSYNEVQLDQELTNYFKAIRSFRAGKLDDALSYSNKLLMQKPNDAFYRELKAQILFEAGRQMALSEYDVAVSMRPKDTLFVLGRAIVGINFFKNEPMKLNPYYRDLQFVIEKEPDNLLALYYLAIYYEKKGLKAKSYLNSAIIADKTGQKDEAVALAKQALKEMKEKGSDWYKANDIIAINE